MKSLSRAFVALNNPVNHPVEVPVALYMSDMCITVVARNFCVGWKDTFV